MRPVNLIPPEDRRGEQAPLRTGPLPYFVLGALVAALIGVAMMVLTDNRISASEDELAALKREDAAASAKAARLASYTAFQSLSEQRAQTVQSLADSRFDWERVLRELSLVLPSDVILDDLSASEAGGEGAEGADSSAAGVSGPSLTMNGCASGYRGVARFVTALKDIDGVTRVGVQSSTAGEGEAGAAEGSCATSTSAVQFSLVAAFDAAPVPAPEGEVAVAPESTPAASAESSEGSGEEAEGG
jgi:Tfp pilus assembly protein PilN